MIKLNNNNLKHEEREIKKGTLFYFTPIYIFCAQNEWKGVFFPEWSTSSRCVAGNSKGKLFLNQSLVWLKWHTRDTWPTLVKLCSYKPIEEIIEGHVSIRQISYIPHLDHACIERTLTGASLLWVFIVRVWFWCRQFSLVTWHHTRNGL